VACPLLIAIYGVGEKMKQNIATIVEDAVKGIVANCGCELYEVEYAKKQNGMNLTLFIVKRSGIVNIDDCEAVHRAVDPILDEINPTGDTPYTLNVSSLGLDRPIKSDKDFEWNVGKVVDVKLFEKLQNKKEFEGKILAFDGKVVTFDVAGEMLEVPKNIIAGCKLHLDF
jgi:ribosome maturation factor RimP